MGNQLDNRGILDHQGVRLEKFHCTNILKFIVIKLIMNYSFSEQKEGADLERGHNQICHYC